MSMWIMVLKMILLTAILEKFVNGCYDVPNVIVKTEHFENYRELYIDGHWQQVRQINKNVTTHGTIICQDVDQLLTHNYSDKPYEQFLILMHSRTATLEASIFLKFDTITKLYLNKLHLREITPGAFSGLLSLRELYLEDNAITAITKGTFDHLDHLELLNLANNNLDKIHRNAFTNLKRLQVLLLGNNNLKTITLLGWSVSLQMLDLSGNPLQHLEGIDKLYGVKKLFLNETSLSTLDADLSHLPTTVLNMSSSQLVEINFDMFPIQLEILDLSHNLIRNGSMSVNMSLSEFYISHNKLTQIECVFNEDMKTSLEILDFSFNRIEELSVNTFAGLHLLRRLYLQHNNLEKIPIGVFRDLKNLHYLDLSANSIVKFQFGTFDALKNLAYMDVSHNNLTDLNQAVFVSLTNLTNLNFDHNQIASIDVAELTKHLNQLRFVSLNHNSWSCKNLVKMFHTLKDSEVIVTEGDSYEVENKHGIACTNSFEIEPDDSYSIKNLTSSLATGIKNGIANSKLSQFFNGDFKESQFYKFFDSGYTRSNFFKYLESYETRSPNQNASRTERLISSGTTITSGGEEGILVTIVILLVLIAFILFAGFYLAFAFVKNLGKLNQRSDLSSQVELIEQVI